MIEDVKIITQEEWDIMKLKLPFIDDNVDFKKCDDFFTKNDKDQKLGLSL